LVWSALHRTNVEQNVRIPPIIRGLVDATARATMAKERAKKALKYIIMLALKAVKMDRSI